MELTDTVGLQITSNGDNADKCTIITSFSAQPVFGRRKWRRPIKNILKNILKPYLYV